MRFLILIMKVEKWRRKIKGGIEDREEGIMKKLIKKVER